MSRQQRGSSAGKRGKRREDGGNRRASAFETWEPRTRLGRQIKRGEITSIEEVFASNMKIQDIEVVDFLCPGLEETVLDVKRVQRQTDAGRKTAFQAIAAVGNKNGLIGVASGKDVGMGTAIRNAIRNAKLALAPIKRGCGSWECACTTDVHSIPFSTKGQCASVKVTLLPAPRGLGLVTGDAAKKVLDLAGVKDCWSNSLGDTRTTANYVKAVFDALKATYHMQDPSEW